MIDLVGRRRWFFILSGLLLVPGVIAILLGGLRPGVDFTGGTLWEMRFREARPEPAQLREIFEHAGVPGASIQASGADTLLVRTRQIDEGSEEKAALTQAVQARFGAFDERFDSVGPAVGAELAQRAVLAVGLASLGICAYIWFAFRSVPNALRYGVTAITALLHDALIMLGIFALLGLLFGWEIDGLFVTAILTAIGFSVHDTIVVFDRVRENLRRGAGEPFAVVVNHSLVQTLARSLNTSLTTVIGLLALLLLGGPSMHGFVTALLVGIVVGTFSSIFFASMLLVFWDDVQSARRAGAEPVPIGQRTLAVVAGHGEPSGVEHGRPKSVAAGRRSAEG